MDLTDKKVVVVGTGVSGMGAVKLLSETSADITLYDGNDKADRDEILKKIPDDCDLRLIIGEMPDEVVKETDLLVISPGVPIDSDIVKLFEKENVPVWGEIELAYNFEKGTVFAITGTNGKTTTTTLVGEIMKKYNNQTFVVGNIGNSYTSEVLKTTKDSYTVAEISSFQLETIREFAPRGSAILNITPDHLNRHYTMENYAAVKESITKNQWKVREDDYCVLNYDDKVLREFGKTIKNPVYFSRKEKPSKGAYLDGRIIRYFDGKNDYEVMSVDDMHLFGNHNYENVMAAIAMTIEAGVPLNIIINVIKDFMGVEHRIEYVRDKNGVRYYNDSKGTNPDSSIKALEAMSRPTILIAGGYDKHSEFDEFIEAFDNKVKLMVLLGQTADKIEETAVRHGFTNIIKTDSLEKAVKICAENAVSGDVVLLSPACASWGMFKNYEERGKLFKEYVNSL
ncbi:UDP-N-acetylmuramoyl-L-alanine--D-glutamate ligase [Eshraghiella crossota]|uniref:UDP-N-acetylmuramoylalanine--D-glutamate ligase n=2 Tax=Eshraghiella TaxID=3342669 RepID=D4RWX9_9FIRM|nr:UDP-N-acetylmuramoyl-L-alanine--D-glutamate ligase [Butyrivibrio crossotus]EFF69419.1 UDP-N-acetylmuramoyl-L-alanine--D-glutamate ligase [Butyrivibrio crossotus DSM 2876]UWO49940.1 UDP-N-acetylmuramoyl-L-alanine--D-glutamate ligase [Butyrivibrio crossotus]